MVDFNSNNSMPTQRNRNVLLYMAFSLNIDRTHLDIHAPNFLNLAVIT